MKYHRIRAVRTGTLLTPGEAILFLVLQVNPFYLDFITIHMHITFFFPKLSEALHLISFADIAVKYLEQLGWLFCL